MTTPTVPVHGRRAAAVATLVLGVVFVAAVTIILFHSPRWLLAAWLGMVITIFGLSRAFGPPSLARTASRVLTVSGIVVMLVALIELAIDSPWATVALFVLLIAIGFVGTYALRSPAPVIARLSAQHPVLLVNPKSGGGKATKAGLADIARAKGIEVRVLEKHDDLTEMARDAIAGGADAVAMAGGDGSLGYVATATIEAGVPFICIPAGTRNHFARDLGLDRSDVVGALDAFNGEMRIIDYASVNGRVFVNVASLGLYATIVSDPSYRDAKAETTIGTMQKLEESGERFDLHFTDAAGHDRASADLIMVSNNRYTVTGLLTDIGKRERLDRGELGVLMLEIPDAKGVAKFATLYAAGTVNRYEGWEQWEAAQFRVGSGSSVPIGVDGETIAMEPPLEFTIHRGAFTVAVPPGTPYGPGVSPLGTKQGLSRLWAVAMGRPLD